MIPDTNTRLQLLGFRASFLTPVTSLAFLGAPNLIGWAAEVTLSEIRKMIELTNWTTKKWSRVLSLLAE